MELHFFPEKKERLILTPSPSPKERVAKKLLFTLKKSNFMKKLEAVSRK
jgi:hypothetical protein